MSSGSSSTTFAPTPFDGDGVCKAVVTAVADAKGVSPAEVSPPFSTAIDPDALEKVVASMSDGTDEPRGSIEFPFSGFEITVTGDRDVSVTPLDAPPV